MGNYLVLQTDFGLGDGAVSAMYGVAHTVSREIVVEDLTHDIPPYDIWSASYRLLQTVAYWPEGTVFVSVVDPGVGSARRSVAAKTSSGHFVITPDNGTLTHLHNNLGIEEVRQIDEVKSRLPHSEDSHTFHGRDVYAYNGARLASGEILFEELGAVVSLESIVQLETVPITIENDVVKGGIDILDIRFGSLWTNIPLEVVKKVGLEPNDLVQVTIYHKTTKVYQNTVTFVRSFAEVSIGQPLVYVNSLLNIGVAINQASFSKVYNIGIGKNWKIDLKKVVVS
ncbi:S-adenosyl-l-methionine hydroxide adenosyltransferase family protein [Desemzia sp. RIT804]|nr:S-adenosyl-l-methionine hydroxide adenosyltransferase family protein [Desemzia sp. RIT 804]MBM6615239.1 S-adenosyl-l-methionine hydroxide adenosyltransferase family protein [Desemzia sp. RIT 804]